MGIDKGHPVEVDLDAIAPAQRQTLERVRHPSVGADVEFTDNAQEAERRVARVLDVGVQRGPLSPGGAAPTSRAPNFANRRSEPSASQATRRRGSTAARGHGGTGAAGTGAPAHRAPGTGAGIAASVAD